MKLLHVVVPWAAGLHLRPAAQLVQVARGFRATIHLRCADKIADTRNILSLLALCATLGTPLTVEITGDDEQAAGQRIEQVFAEGGGTVADGPERG